VLVVVLSQQIAYAKKFAGNPSTPNNDARCFHNFNVSFIVHYLLSFLAT